jgi:hypothetical protein
MLAHSAVADPAPSRAFPETLPSSTWVLPVVGYGEPLMPAIPGKTYLMVSLAEALALLP